MILYRNTLVDPTKAYREYERQITTVLLRTIAAGTLHWCRSQLSETHKTRINSYPRGSL